MRLAAAPLPRYTPSVLALVLAAIASGEPSSYEELRKSYETKLAEQGARMSAADRVRGANALLAVKLLREPPAPQEGEALEKRLKSDPGDVLARLRLLSLYRAGDAQRRRPHVLWFIRNMPESDLHQQPLLTPDHSWVFEARSSWEPVVSSSNAAAEQLAAAAASVGYRYAADARDWLRRAVELEPKRALWRDLLAQQLTLGADADGERAAEALAALERAETLGPGWAGDRRPEMARLALESGDLDKARALAEAALSDLGSMELFQRASALSESRTVLAELALRDGKLEEARRELLASCEPVPGSHEGFPRPDRRLAAELERRGRAGTVDAFERACARYLGR